MKLSISIVNWNTKDLLVKCLESISNSTYKDLEIFVIDNNSSDESAKIVKTRFPSVHLIENTDNLGFGKANNLALREIHGKYALILNPDIVFFEDTINDMIDFMDNNPSAGAIGISLLDQNMEEDTRGYFRKFPSILQVLFFYTLLERFTLKSAWLKNKLWSSSTSSDIIEIEQVPGACLLVRRDILEKIGLFDEVFPLFFEDVDLCYRIHQSGHKILYVPSIRAIHIGAQSISKLTYTELAGRFFYGMIYFFRKHHSKTKANVVKVIIIINTWFKYFFVRSLYYLSDYKRNKRKEHTDMLRQFMRNLWKM